MNVLSLFAGIGGIDLGLQRAGMRIVGQVEIDPYCRAVLARHWPEVPRHDDVRTAVAWWLETARPAVDLIAGGFPCQDVSEAGRRTGIDGERSGLWAYFAQIIRALRPRYVLVENTRGLLVRGMGRVVGDLANLGYDAEWDCIPAAAVGAPHVRARMWILAYPSGIGRNASGPQARILGAQPPTQAQHWSLHVPEPFGSPRAGGRDAGYGLDGRVADGVPSGLDLARIAACGNAVVPQVVEHIGRLILAAEAVSA